MSQCSCIKWCHVCGPMFTGKDEPSAQVLAPHCLGIGPSEGPNAFDDNGNPIVMGLSAGEKPSESAASKLQQESHTGQSDAEAELSPDLRNDKIKMLEAELAALKDTPGGKRLYGAINEIERLRAENKELQAKLAKEFRPAYDTLELVKERDELRAENERLKLMGTRTSYAALAEENNALRAERDELKNDFALTPKGFAFMKERDELRAEVERLKLEGQQTEDNLQEAWRERDSLRTQCEKLAVALKDIAETLNDCTVVCRKCGDEETLQDSDMAFIAREALAEYEQGTKYVTTDITAQVKAALKGQK